MATRKEFEFKGEGKQIEPVISSPSRPGGARSRRGPCPWTARKGTPRRTSRSRSPPAPSSSSSPTWLRLSQAALRGGLGNSAMVAAPPGHEVSPPMDGWDSFSAQRSDLGWAQIICPVWFCECASKPELNHILARGPWIREAKRFVSNRNFVLSQKKKNRNFVPRSSVSGNYIKKVQKAYQSSGLRRKLVLNFGPTCLS